MYNKKEKISSIRQGDILKDIPFSFNKLSILFQARKKYQNKDRTFSFELLKFAPEKTDKNTRNLYLLSKYPEVSFGMVVSQDCDIERKKMINIAQIRPLIESDYKSYIEESSYGDKPALALALFLKYEIRRAHKWFYLKSDNTFPRSVVVLSKQITVSNKAGEEYDYLLSRIILRLEEYARRDLQYKLGHYFGRYAGPDYYWLTDREKQLADSIV